MPRREARTLTVQSSTPSILRGAEGLTRVRIAHAFGIGAD
jgi:hypothetical protein